MPAARELRPGDVVAEKYRVRSILSRSRGLLVDATHTEFDQRVVVRVIAPESVEPREVERFRRESRLLAKLETEHAARIIDVGSHADGSLYLVRQHLEGITLAEHLKKAGPLPIWDAVLYVLQAADAVAEAHAHGVIVRELATRDLFLTSRLAGPPIIKVIDFGTAKLLRGEGGHGEVTTFAGPGRYCAPELVRGDVVIDERADVWSLGVILFELLAGKPPFDGEGMRLMLQITKELPPQLTSLRSEVPATLATVINRALTKVVGSRYPDVYSLAKGLGKFTPASGRVLIDRIHQLDRASKERQKDSLPPGPRDGIGDDATPTDEDALIVAEPDELLVPDTADIEEDDVTRVAHKRDIEAMEDDSDLTQVAPMPHDPGESTVPMGARPPSRGPAPEPPTPFPRQARSLHAETTEPVGRTFVPPTPAPPPPPRPPIRPSQPPPLPIQPPDPNRVSAPPPSGVDPYGQSGLPSVDGASFDPYGQLGPYGDPTMGPASLDEAEMLAMAQNRRRIVVGILLLGVLFLASLLITLLLTGG